MLGTNKQANNNKQTTLADKQNQINIIIFNQIFFGKKNIFNVKHLIDVRIITWQKQQQRKENFK